MRRLDSIILTAAAATGVPAGSALAVDRSAFAKKVKEILDGTGLIIWREEEITSLPADEVITSVNRAAAPSSGKTISLPADEIITTQITDKGTAPSSGKTTSLTADEAAAPSAGKITSLSNDSATSSASILDADSYSY